MSNPLALAVLALLNERPMHPYEMSTTMRERHKEKSIKLNYGSLYTVVDTLVRSGFIVASETVREGRRPERTIYAITESGRVGLYDWMSELVSTPVKEFTQFEAALSLLAVLPPSDAARLLAERRQRLTTEVELNRATEKIVARDGVPKLFFLEAEYVNALRETELRFVESLLVQIATRTLDGIELWEAFHADTGDPERDLARVAELKSRLADERWGEAAAMIMQAPKTPKTPAARPATDDTRPTSGGATTG
jgi:DNA-binding PadR family transcriptional regulator